MDKKRAASLIGLAAKAGKVVSGEENVLNSIRGGKAFAVMISSEASLRSRKTFGDKCSYYRVPLFEWGTKEETGRCIGKDSRTVFCITDRNFGEEIIKLLREEDTDNGKDSDNEDHKRIKGKGDRGLE